MKGPIGRKPNGSCVTVVRDLIDENRNWWNETIIDEVFDPSTVRVIKRMPLRSLSSHDVVTWSEAPFGTYSVSTAYL